MQREFDFSPQITAQINAFVRTPEEMINESFKYSARRFILDSHRLPWQIESRVKMETEKLLQNPEAQIGSAELNTARNEYDRFLERTDSWHSRNIVSTVLERDLDDVEMNGSREEKIVARYFLAIKTTLASNVLQGSHWYYRNRLEEITVVENFSQLSQVDQQEAAEEILEKASGFYASMLIGAAGALSLIGGLAWGIKSSASLEPGIFILLGSVGLAIPLLFYYALKEGQVDWVPKPIVLEDQLKLVKDLAALVENSSIANAGLPPLPEVAFRLAEIESATTVQAGTPVRISTK